MVVVRSKSINSESKIFHSNSSVQNLFVNYMVCILYFFQQLGETLMWMMTSFLNVISSVIVNAVVTPVFLVIILPVVVGFFILQQFFIRTSM